MPGCRSGRHLWQQWRATVWWKQRHFGVQRGAGDHCRGHWHGRWQQWRALPRIWASRIHEQQVPFLYSRMCLYRVCKLTACTVGCVDQGCCLTAAAGAVEGEAGTRRAIRTTTGGIMGGVAGGIAEVGVIAATVASAAVTDGAVRALSAPAQLATHHVYPWLPAQQCPHVCHSGYWADSYYWFRGGYWSGAFR